MKMRNRIFCSLSLVLFVSTAASQGAVIAISGNQFLAGQGNSGELAGANSATALQVRNGYSLTVESGATVNLSSGINVSQGVDGNGANITQLESSTVSAGGSMSMSGNSTGGTSFYTLRGGSLSVNNNFNVGANYVATFSMVGSAADFTVGGDINANALSVFDFTFGATGVGSIDAIGAMSIISGAQLNIDGSSYTGGAGTISLFSYGSTPTVAEFAESVTGFSGLDSDIQYTATGIDLVLTAIPEPSSVVLLGLGSLALLTRRRR